MSSGSCFCVGQPAQYRVRAMFSDEDIRGITASADGHAFVVWSPWRLHVFSSTSSGNNFLGSFDVPGCGTAASTDAISAVTLSMDTRYALVSTTGRRLVTAKLRACSDLGTGPQPIGELAVATGCLEASVDHGIVLAMRCTRASVFGVTSNGGIVVRGASDAAGNLRVIRSAAICGEAEQHAPVVDLDLCLREEAPHAARLFVLLGDGTLAGVDVSEAGALSADAWRCTAPTDRAQSVSVSREGDYVATVGASFATLAIRQVYADGFGDPAPVGARLDGGWSERTTTAAVSALRWSPRGLLCAAIDRVGVVLFHSSGVVAFTSFPRYSAGGGPGAARQLLSCGVRAAAFARDGASLVVAEPNSASFEAVELGTIAASPTGADPAMVDARGVSFFRWAAAPASASAVDTPQVDTGWERVSPPAEYLASTAPLRFAAVSPDGQQLAVVGTRGFALHSRRLHRWRYFGSTGEEDATTVTAEPAWVGNNAVAVATCTRTRRLFGGESTEYAVEVYPRHHPDPSARLARHVVAGPVSTLRGTLLQGHVWLLVAAIERRGAELISLELHADSVANPLRQHGHVAGSQALPGLREAVNAPPSNAAWLDDAFAVPGPRVGDSRLLLAVRTRHRGPQLQLLSVSGTGVLRPLLQVEAFSAWTIPVAPATFPRSSILAVFNSTGCHVLTPDRAGAWESVKVANVDPDEGLPIGACGGQIVCAREGSWTITPRMFPRFVVRCGPVSVAHVALLRAFTGGAGSEWAAPQVEAACALLRDEGTFLGTFDVLVHAVVHDDAPPWDRDIDRRAALRRVLAHLRSYLDYYEVVVRCVRKGDVAFWRVVFDVVGAPHVFLEECVAHNRVREAVHFVRVLLMERPDDTTWSLEQSTVAARRLLAIVIARHDFGLAYELLRFVALLMSEINLPPIAAPIQHGRGIGAIESMLRAVWPIGGDGAPNAAAAPSAARQQQQQAALGQPQRLLGTGSGSVEAGASAVRPRPASGHDESGSEPVWSSEGRVNAMHATLAQNSLLRDMLDIEATELLKRGQVLQLCRLFDIFALDIAHFIARRYDTVVDTLDLSAVWRTLHADLGLPLATRSITGDGRGVFDTSGGTVFTETQEFLAECPRALAAVRSLSRYFAFLGMAEPAAMLDLLLIRGGPVQAAMRAIPLVGERLGRAVRRDDAMRPYSRLVLPMKQVHVVTAEDSGSSDGSVRVLGLDESP